MKFEQIKEMVSNSYVKALGVVAVAGSWAGAKVSATPLIDNDTLEGLPQLGTDVGDFMGNLAPGLGKFILILGIFVGIVGILGAIFLIMKKVTMKGSGK